MRIAVVGCGYWGKNLVRNFNQLGTLSLVCDATQQGRELAQEIVPECQVVSDYTAVLDSAVDGVVIATPAETHFQLAKAALEAGKDVFVEKPLAMNYESGELLVDLAEQFERILMVGHVLEYHPGIERLFGLIRAGELGKMSFAPHDIAVILRILGSLPLQVVACGGGYVQPNVADVTVTNMLFNNGVRAHIYVSWLHPFKEQRLVVIGSKKMASFNDVSKQLLIYDQRIELKEGFPVPIRKDGEELPYEHAEPLRRECEAFLNAIKTRQPPRTDGISGLNALKVLQAAQRSLMMNGEQVTVSGMSLGLPQAVTVIPSNKNGNGVRDNNFGSVGDSQKLSE